MGDNHNGAENVTLAEARAKALENAGAVDQGRDPYDRSRVPTFEQAAEMLHVRMDTEMKRKATTALAAMGLTPSEAVRLLFHRIAVDQAFPLELKVPNAQTRRAMAEVDEMVKTRTARFASADEMSAELEEARGQ